MSRISFTYVSILLLCTLILPATSAQPILKRSETTTPQSLDFQHIVQVLTEIVEGIQDEARKEKREMLVPPNVQVLPKETLQSDDLEDLSTDLVPSDEPTIDDEVGTEQSPEPTEPLPEISYKLHVVEPLSGTADAAVIVLHGLGQSIETLLPITHAIALAGLSNIRFIVPQAPTRYVTIEDREMPSWFDIASTGADEPEAREEILLAARNIAAIKDSQERDHGIAAGRVALIGLSQGGAVALTAYLRYRWAGAMTVSTWLPLRDSYPEEMSDDSKDAKLVMMHGAEDMLIPKEWARLSAKLIEDLGRNVSYVELEGEGHWLAGAVDAVITTALNTLKEALP